MFYVTTQSFWSLNKYDVMLTENATSVQYFKSLLSRKQKSVVSKSTFAIKEREIVVMRHIHTQFGRSS